MNPHKLLKQWLLPPKIYTAIGQLHLDYIARASGKEKEIIRLNEHFRDKYKGKRCFVIGNGSSLNKINLEYLKGEITIGMNRIYLHKLCQSWTPTIYCSIDQADKTKSNLARIETLKELTPEFSPEGGYFFHISEKTYIDALPINQKNTFYLKTDIAIDTVTDITKSWDLTKVIPGIRSTAQTAIMIAMYMGCNPIYLIGMDTDWLTHRTIDNHFYPGDGIEADLGTIPYEVFVAATLRQFKGYTIIKKYADHRGIKIFNATPGSFLETFPMVDYNTLFNVG